MAVDSILALGDKVKQLTDEQYDLLRDFIYSCESLKEGIVTDPEFTRHQLVKLLLNFLIDFQFEAVK